MDSLATPIPKGDTPLTEGEAKFPIQLPEGLTTEIIKSKSKHYIKVWKEWIRPYAEQLKAFYNMFEGGNVGDKRSKNEMVLSVVASIVETLTSRLCKQIWGKDKLIDAMPLDFGISKEETKTVEDFLNQELIYVSRGTKKGKSLIKAAIIEGVGMWREMWKVKNEKRMMPTYETAAMGIEPIYTGDQEQETSYQCWDWEEMDPLKVIFEPSTETSLAESPVAGFRGHMSLSDFKQWEKAGKIANVDEIAALTPSQVTNKDDWQTKRKNMLGYGFANFEYADEKEYLVDEFYCDLAWEVDQEGVDLEGKALPKKVVSGRYHWIIVEEEHIILFEANSLRPERVPGGSFPFIIRPRKVIGKSALQDVQKLQGIIDTFGGKQVDLVEQAANRPVYYDQRSGLAGKTSFRKTQGLIAVDNVEGIKEGVVNTQALEANQGFLVFLIEFARNITAATEQAQGLEGAKTATEFAGLVQLVGTRFEDLADNIMQYFITPLAQGCLDYYQQYGIDGQMIVRESSIDGEPRLVTRQMLSRRWQIVPSGNNAQANKDARIKAAIETMKMLMELGQAAMATQGALTGGMIPNLKAFFEEVLMTLMDQKQSQNMWMPLPMMGMVPGMAPAGAAPGPTGPEGPSMPMEPMMPMGPSPEQMGMMRP